MTMLMPETAHPAADGAAPTPRLRDQFCFALYATSHAVARRYKPLLAPLGVTYPQYICLMSLWERDDVTVSTLGTAMLLDSGTLTPLLKRLERAGLLLRARDPEDERQVRIRLTDAGRELQRSAAAVMDRIVCATGRPMAEIADLRDDLVAIRQSLDEDTVAAEASLARGPRAR